MIRLALQELQTTGTEEPRSRRGPDNAKEQERRRGKRWAAVWVWVVVDRGDASDTTISRALVCRVRCEGEERGGPPLGDKSADVYVFSRLFDAAHPLNGLLIHSDSHSHSHPLPRLEPLS